MMRVCDEKEKTYKVLRYRNLSQGDVFDWALRHGDGDPAVMVKTNEATAHTYLSGNNVYATGKHVNIGKGDAEVILYPDACIKLGDPAP